MANHDYIQLSISFDIFGQILSKLHMVLFYTKVTFETTCHILFKTTQHHTSLHHHENQSKKVK